MHQTQYTTFKLSVQMKSAVIIHGPLTLESLLAAATHEKSGATREQALSDVPISTATVAGRRLWLSSGVMYQGTMRYRQETIIRRRRGDEVGEEFYDANPRQRKDPWAIDQARGRHKALLNTYLAWQADTLVWLADGNPERCADLLRSLMFIGKRRGQGFGEIGYVQWSYADDNPIVAPDGSVRRPVPIAMLPFLSGALPAEKQNIAHTACNHPFWDSQAEACAVMSDFSYRAPAAEFYQS